ncbi:uncharacterized protein PG986_013585 [Apiospora aurea]|uniref:Major facilitator superfamily (MFS) profile domain-containing protein n=1 Tax=Apiospora aurea TaxID=335848 RepID=A0ABR1PWC0_9PEZI
MARGPDHIVVQSTGCFLPGVYLHVYVLAAFGASGFRSALTILLVNITVTVGSVLLGSLSDRLHLRTCVVISALFGGTVMLLIWGLLSSRAVLYLFCVVYSLFVEGWTSMWPGVMREVARRATAVQDISEGSVEGQAQAQGNDDPLCVGRDVGNAISGPLSSGECLGKG